MGDTLNALQMMQGPRASPGSLPPSVVANPLAALQAGTTAASNVMDLRNKQADQAWGSALQQATDPKTGVVDYNAAARIAASMGPVAQMGMARNLANASNIKSQQQAQGVTRNTAVGNAIIGALDGDDAGLHDRVVSGFNGLVANGVMTQDEATRSALALPSDPTQLRQRLQQIQTSLSPPELQQEQLQGSHVQITTPGATYNITQPPTRRGGTVITPHGVSPDATTTVSVPMDDQGVIPQDANGVPARPPKTWQKVPAFVGGLPGAPKGGPPTYQPPQTSTAPPPPPKGTTGIRGAYPTPPAPAPAPAPTPAPAPAPTPAPAPAPSASGASAGGKGAPAAAPAAPAPPPPPPPPKLPPNAPTAALQGGVQVASADPRFMPTPGATASPASSQVASDVAAINAGRANARATPAGGVQTAQGYGPFVRSEPPPGFTERLALDQKQYGDDQNAQPARVTNVQNLNTALDALKLTNTGRSTGAVHNFYSFLVSQGVAPGFIDNDVTQYDIARKAMMAFASSRVTGAAGTDLARVQAELANASPEISQAAAIHVIKQNLGLENMAIAAFKQHGDKTGAGYGDSRSQFYQDYDPRAFAWDKYDPEERGAMQAQAEHDGTIDKLRASVRKALDLKMIQAPKQQSQATPPSNGGPTQNALSAAPTSAIASAAPANALAAA